MLLNYQLDALEHVLANEVIGIGGRHDAADAAEVGGDARRVPERRGRELLVRVVHVLRDRGLVLRHDGAVRCEDPVLEGLARLQRRLGGGLPCGKDVVDRHVLEPDLLRRLLRGLLGALLLRVLFRHGVTSYVSRWSLVASRWSLVASRGSCSTR